MDTREIRSRTPDRAGMAVRAGVELSWVAYGSGEPTILLMPTWSIVDSRVWKMQIPYLARHFRVLTFDGRGSGGSSKPSGPQAYANREFAADAAAVLDDAGVDRAVVVALSAGAAWSVHLATAHPERVLGVVAIGASCRLGAPAPNRDPYPWENRHDTIEGWAKYNRYYWLEGGYQDFLEFFFGEMFSEPHSTKQIEDAIRWAGETDPAVLVDTVPAQRGEPPGAPSLEELCKRVSCPVLVMHGRDDRIPSYKIAVRLAELTGGELVLIDGGGHGLPSRAPVLVNSAVRRFAERLVPPSGRRPARRSGRRPRVLYLSSPIGLGHARRDLAIADSLRAQRPDVQIDWLAQDPVTRVLVEQGEKVHPASSALASESGHIEAECGEHDLHAFQAIRRMDDILVNNFGVFADLLEQERYDLVVGDEAWEVDYYLHENPALKRSAYAWLTDFVGWLPMPDDGPAEAALTADYNAEMLGHRARLRELRDRSIFVGNSDDIVPDAFGPGLPAIRAWTERNYDFAGYVTGSQVDADRDEARERLGYRTDERICLVTVGGSGVGVPLLRRIVASAAHLRRLAPDLRMVVVTGPRIDPSVVPPTEGATVVGYLPDLDRHLAAADVAVVQGGLTTCMELTAARRPFLYVPLRHHFEQNFHVRHRLERYRAGRCVEYDDLADPDQLAAAVVAELERPLDYRPVETDGAARAAALLADLI
ncbi:MAG TPA: alpha/beta fold hydrolase [Nakamurella sp.]